jgi:3-oxoacyl-[acyl-carrier-protein] synthase-1
MMTPLKLTSYTLTTALGNGLEPNWQGLRDSTSGLQPCDFFNISDLKTWVGEVSDVDAVTLPEPLTAYDCRNNRLALMALQQDGFEDAVNDAIARYGADRVAVFIGTSTSGTHQTELAYFERKTEESALPDWYQYRETHNVYSSADFISAYFGIKGISSVISTACSSSAKVFASAHRAIETGLCDVALVGGVDSLCLTTLYGFNSLQVISENICRPSDSERSGISIGEAAGFALVEKIDPSKNDNTGADNQGYALLGYGESSDAYHMSTPHPEGEGAVLAMQTALTRAQLNPSDISYINLHGTGTEANDLAESAAVTTLFGDQLPCSSTKGWTGHTLGAAGIVEAIFSVLCLRENWLPQSLNTKNVDERVKAGILTENTATDTRYVLSNSFGFGGSNCSLILGKL